MDYKTEDKIFEYSLTAGFGLLTAINTVATIVHDENAVAAGTAILAAGCAKLTHSSIQRIREMPAFSPDISP